MLSFLPGPLKAALAFILYLLNTLFWVPWLLLMALLKLAIPWTPWRKLTNRVIIWIATSWISVNNFNNRLFLRTRVEVDIKGELDKDQWYLVLSNHQSWVDILVLQRIFNRKIPFLKFFLKKELLYVPLMGLAWWALDFPFMKRYSQDKLRKKPHLAGRDLDITRKACDKFKYIPVSVMNFVEGTRFTTEKHERQESPHENLLRPKAGGIAVVLDAMGEHLTRIVNVTIAYPYGAKGFWAFLSGKVKEVRVRVESMPISKDQLGDYFHDNEYRERFQQWLNVMWEEKDRQLKDMISRALPAPRQADEGQEG